MFLNTFIARILRLTQPTIPIEHMLDHTKGMLQGNQDQLVYGNICLKDHALRVLN